MEYKLHDIVLLRKYPKPRYGTEAEMVGVVYGVVTFVSGAGSSDPYIKVYVKKEQRTYQYPGNTVRLELVHRFNGDKPKELTLKFKAVYLKGEIYLKIDDDRSAPFNIMKLNLDNIIEVKDLEIPQEKMKEVQNLTKFDISNYYTQEAIYFDNSNPWSMVMDGSFEDLPSLNREPF